MTTTVTCRSFYCKVKTRQQQRNSTNQTTPYENGDGGSSSCSYSVVTAWLWNLHHVKEFWTLDGKLPAQAQQFASMTWRRSRKSSKVSNMFQSCKCATCCIMSFSDEHSSGLSECFHHIQAQKTWRKWRFCSSTYFLSYSALLTSFSCPWNNETFCKKDNKDQFDRQHEACFCLTASAVASSKESKAAKSCVCLWITAALFTCPLYRSSLAAGRTRTFPSGLFGSVGTLRKNKCDKSWSLITLSVMFSICVRAVIGVFPVSVWCDTWSFSSPWKHRLCLW